MLHSEDAHVYALPFLRWEGAKTPTFTHPHHPCTATCIDHLTVWDPRHLTNQIRKAITLLTPFLYHKGVLETILLSVLTEEATVPPPARTPRVVTFLFPVLEQAMETWRSKVAIDSAVAIAFSSAMARSILVFLSGDNI